MRTKALLCAAALAAGVATSMAQSNVYSLNVVGYVNTPILNQNFTFVCNPLSAATNDLQNTVLNPPDSTVAYLWDNSQEKFEAEISGNLPQYSTFNHQWSFNTTIAPGKGFFLVGGDDPNVHPTFTNTWVGNVLQGTPAASVSILVGKFCAIASPVPISGNISNVLVGMTFTDGDVLYEWSNDTQQKFVSEITGNLPQYSSFTGTWSFDPTLKVGEGFFYVSAAQNNFTWNRNFTVQ